MDLASQIAHESGRSGRSHGAHLGIKLRDAPTVWQDAPAPNGGMPGVPDHSLAIGGRPIPLVQTLARDMVRATRQAFDGG